MAIDVDGYRRVMGIGAGIFLIAVGAILTFAVDWHVAGVDLQVVGWVLMLAGLAGVILFFAYWQRRGTGRVVSEREVYRDPAVERRVYDSQRRTFEDPPPHPGA